MPPVQPRVQGAGSQELGLDESRWEQYRLYVSDLLHGDLDVAAESEGSADELIEPLKNTLPMIALGTLFAIVFGTITG